MIKYHETIEPLIPSNFFNDTVDLWFGFKTGHMGHHLYKHHTAIKNKKSMSGLTTWFNHAEKGSLPKLTKESLKQALPHLSKQHLDSKTVIEFGPGSMVDALPLLTATNSSRYIPVDCSLEILKQAQNFSTNHPHFSVEPAVTDFFSRNTPPLTKNKAFGALLGLTISNIPGSIKKEKPKKELVGLLRNLSQTMPAGGCLLIQVDTCQSAAQNIHRYSEYHHSLFGVNHIYRMQKELNMKEFDPSGFSYLPTWHEESGLLAHNVVATKDQSFYMGDHNKTFVSVSKGDIFHYNNSYKYRHNFFEECAADAGLNVIEHWQDDSSICMYLLSVPAQNEAIQFAQPANELNTTPLQLLVTN